MAELQPLNGAGAHHPAAYLLAPSLRRTFSAPRSGPAGALAVWRTPTPFRQKGGSIEISNPFDDGGDAHAAADAQGDQGGGEVAPLELVEGGVE